MNHIKYTNLKRVRNWMAAFMMVLVSAVPAMAQGVEESSIPDSAYKNFFFGVLLVVLAAAIIGIIGRVISIYALTTKMNGRFNPLAGNNLQANLLLISLPIFLY